MSPSSGIFTRIYSYTIYEYMYEWSEIKLLLSLFGGGIYVRCGGVKKCCLTMHSSFLTLSCMVLYWESRELNFACMYRFGTLLSKKTKPDMHSVGPL